MNLSWQMDMVQEALRNLRRHKLRTLLTLLGVLIGVAAVITMLGIGEGAQRTVLRDIAGLGLRNIIIESTPATALDRQPQTQGRGPRIVSYGLVRKDALQLQALQADARVLLNHVVKEKVFQHGRRLEAQVIGADPRYFEVVDMDVVRGRPLALLDQEEGRRVALVSEPFAASLKMRVGEAQPVIQIGRSFFTVVGVARVPARAAASLVFLPYRTALATFGTTTIKWEASSVEFSKVEIGQIVMQAAREDDVPALAQAVRRTLQLSHPSLDYQLTVPLEILEAKQRTQRILNLVLIAIAAISLVVGGIGIMNIMLAAVTERIPEIGVRRAVGATRRDILWQFLTETITLSTVGGVVGCLLGFVMVPLASRWTGWNGVITPGSVIVSLVVSWCVGLVFGLAPAFRAARLDPVDALRHE